MYQQEMNWQPPYAADNLAAMRRAGQRAGLEADRARLNAQWNADAGARERLEHEASTQEGIASLFQWAEQQYAAQQEAYDAWEQATRTTREYAVAADAELRRRHPDDLIPLLTPAQQPAVALGDQVAVTDDNVWIQLGLDGTVRIPEPEPRPAGTPEPAEATAGPAEAGNPEPAAEEASGTGRKTPLRASPP